MQKHNRQEPDQSTRRTAAIASASASCQVVCLLDVLGFESQLATLGLAALHTKYQKLIDYVQQQTGGIDIVPTPGGQVAVGWLVLGHAYFSDTILFWTRYNRTSLPSFTQLIAEAICRGIEIELPLRGTISVGDLILDRDRGVFLGAPLVEAARTEREQRWIGASFGASFKHPEYDGGFYLNTVLPYKSHYKNAASPLVTGITVDWPRRWRETRTANLEAAVKSLDTDTRFSEYYSVSLSYVNFSASNHDWFRTGKRLDYG